jgi:DNA-binding MarR family transcriptional regulator
MAGEAFNDVLLLVLRLHGSFTAAGEALAKPAGQSLARWLVLDQCRNEPATVSEIARRLRLARQSVQRIADLLAADGLCRYRDNPHHQRAKLLELSAAGRSALYTIDAAQHRWCDTLAATIGEPTLRRTAAALQRLTDVVDTTPPSPARQRTK